MMQRWKSLVLPELLLFSSVLAWNSCKTLVFILSSEELGQG
jgi:hypothetical protein